MELRDLRSTVEDVSQPGTMPASQVVTVFSPKGGVGKTLIACSLAVVSALLLGRKTLLVDLDLDSGDVSVHLDLAEASSVSDLLPYCADLKPETLRRFVSTHKSTGVDAVMAPPRPEMADYVKGHHVASLLDAARRTYHSIVVDSAPALDHDLVYESLQRSDSQVLVVTQDLACLRQGRTALELLRRLGFDPEERTRVVVNRYSESSLLTPTKIKSFLGLARLQSVVEARDAIDRSILDGRPLVMSSPSTEAAQNLISLAHDVLGAQLPAKPSESKPSRLLEAVKRLW